MTPRTLSLGGDTPPQTSAPLGASCDPFARAGALVVVVVVVVVVVI